MFRRDPLENPEPLIRRVYSYVAYRVGDGPHAEDITSEVFERALRYRNSFDPRTGSPSAWLIGIARRCIVDAAAREQPTAEPPEVATAGPEDETIQRLTLRGALAELSDDDRELIALRYGADLSARQIAELFQVKTNAIEVRLHRALSRLRAHLAAEGPSSGDADPVRNPASRPVEESHG